MVWADNDGVRIEALEWSPSSDNEIGTPLVFVSGASGNARFAEIHGVAATEGRIGSRRRKVLGISRRGTGLSDAPGSGYTPRDFADDVAAAIRAAGYGHSVVFGQSLGAAIVLELALSRPSGIAAISLGDFPPRYPDFKSLGTFDAALKQPFEYPSLEAARADMRPSGDAEADQRRWELLRRTRLGEAPDGTVHLLEDRGSLVRMVEESVAAQTDYRDRLQEIACPVLVLQATASRQPNLTDQDIVSYRSIRDVTVEGLPTDHSLGQFGDASALHRVLGVLFDRLDRERLTPHS